MAHWGAPVRPPGEVRQALLQAATQLNREHDGVTWRDMAETAGVGYLVACRTVKNMERAGVLESIGVDKRAHSRRWMKLYAPRSNFATATTDNTDLGRVARSWVQAR